MQKFDYETPVEPLKKRKLQKVAVETPPEVRALLRLDFPEVQKVEVLNPPAPVEIPPVVFPDTQKVEVINPVQIPQAPEVQKVEVVNAQPAPELVKVEVQNFPEFPKQPDITDVRIVNQNEPPQRIPVLRGKRVAVDEYIPVRLTDGERFYKAIDELYAAVSKGSPGNILMSRAVTGQKAIGTSGVAVQLPDNALKNGVIITAKSSNSGSILIGMSDVTTTEDGTGNGYILEAGSSVSYAVTNTSVIWINGNSGDLISFSGS